MGGKRREGRGGEVTGGRKGRKMFTRQEVQEKDVR